MTNVENMIIEEAFANNETHAMLDDYHIDLKSKLQIFNNDRNKQRPVKLMVCNRDSHHLLLLILNNPLVACMVGFHLS